MPTLDREKVAADWAARGFTCDLWTDPPGQRWEDFRHTTDELITVLEGQVEFEIAGQVHHPQIGEELLIPADAVHSARNIGKTTARCTGTNERNQEINMPRAETTRDQGDPFDLARFTSAQEGVYDRALTEIRSGDKRSHWMWFIFPQIDGLGFSSTAKHYAVKSAEEARHYLGHPVLGTRLLECAEALLAVEGRSASEIFGYPDDLKLKSCMTLFESVAGPDSVFGRVLDKYYQGKRDTRTQEILAALEERKDRTKPG